MRNGYTGISIATNLVLVSPSPNRCGGVYLPYALYPEEWFRWKVLSAPWNYISPSWFSLAMQMSKQNKKLYLQYAAALNCAFSWWLINCHMHIN